MNRRAVGNRRVLAAITATTLALSALSATTAQAAEPPQDLPTPQSVPAAKEGDPAETASAPAKAEKQDKIGEADRELLAEAVEKGDREVTLLLATERRRTASVDTAITALGGTVGYVHDELGYVRATVPTAQVDKAAALVQVLKVDLNAAVPLPDPRPEATSAGDAAAAALPPAPGPGTPPANPYMPTDETGAVAFTQAHPTYDGRGVTIGVLDSGVDLDHPALQRTTTGERKIVDWVTATDPLVENDLTWRPMRTQVTGPEFNVSGKNYTSPAGSYLFNRFSESITAASEPGGDVNRDGDRDDAFGVLYNPANNDIWVDADQDAAFEATERMRPYREKFDIGRFGTDNPATPIVESTPFVVEFREDVDLARAGVSGTADFVNIGIVESAHGTHVAGITAANGLYGGAADGAAPGAKLVSSRACSWSGGCTAVALTEGMIDLVVRRDVDVVNMSIGGLPALNDGANARAALYDRLIDTYGVQLFISAGNSGPGINTIGDPSVATSVVSVGSSISRETWLANYGSEVALEQSLHNYSSRGPREDGGFKPNVVAPGSAVSTVPQWLKQADVVETGYALPIGYAMFNGTSMASPQTAGAAALLLSGTYAEGVPVTPAQLRKALYSSADELPDVPAYAQGMGLIDVPGAFELLQQQPAVPGYATSAPVCTPLSAFLATPGTGVGVYNRCAASAGGQTAGKAQVYPVTITRTSGDARSRQHVLTWRGNDGTFRTRARVNLPLGTPVTVEVTARPQAGAHGAILLVDDPGTVGIDHQVLNTVVVGTDLTGPSFGTTTSGRVTRNGTTSLFVTVPAGARALQVDLAGIATGSQTRFIAINPYGVPVESTASTTCYTNRPSACNASSRAYLNPLPGIWELEVEARRTTPFLENPYRLTAAVQGVVVEPEVVRLPAAETGKDTPVSWTVTNRFGPVTIRPEGGPLGSARTGRPTVADGAKLEYAVEVPAGASRFDAAIGNPSDRSADLDLSVYLAGKLVAQQADGDSDEAVSIANPAAGTYTVVVDGYEVPAGTTEFDYRDVFSAASLGRLAVNGGERTLAAGASVTVDGVVQPLAAASQGRSLFGEMVVRSAAGAVLGTGSVVIGAPAAPAAEAPAPVATPTPTPVAPVEDLEVRAPSKGDTRGVSPAGEQ